MKTKASKRPSAPLVRDNLPSKQGRVVDSRGWTSRSATSLTEILVAATVLGILATAILSSISSGMLMLQLTRENSRATQIMLEKLESVRLYNWTEVTNAGYVPASFTDYYAPAGGNNQQGPTYNGTIVVGNVPFNTSYSANMRLFTVTLRWSTNGKISHTRTVNTYVAKDGMQNYVY